MPDAPTTALDVIAADTAAHAAQAEAETNLAAAAFAVTQADTDLAGLLHVGGPLVQVLDPETGACLVWESDDAGTFRTTPARLADRVSLPLGPPPPPPTGDAP
jgi:hypothetical protein